MKYNLAESPWTDGEFAAIANVIASEQTTMGEQTALYEQELAKYFKSRFAVTVNSGSSANLLMVASQFFRSDDKRLKTKDEVIVPVLGWSTTFSPLQQYGLKLRFVDVSIDDLCINPNLVEAAITNRTKAILAVDLLGNPCHYDVLLKICKEHNLTLLEDSCEAMGGTIGTKFLGTFGECGTFSTFFSHHISTIEGGIVLTDNEELYHILLSLRSHGWTRNQPQNSRFYKENKDAWEFILPGYNVRPNEVTSAIGRVQLPKLNDFMIYRRKNALTFDKLFSDFPNIQILKPRAWSAYFGFVLILKNELADRRDELTKFLNKNGIETRPVISGSFLRHEAVKFYNYSVYKDIIAANEVHDRGIMTGNLGRDLTKELEYTFDKLIEFVE